MMLRILLLMVCLALAATAQNFTIINGQIYTPGLAIVDAPQPFTPEGGDYLQVALDVSGNGHLSLPPYQNNASTQIHNITIFLFSYDTGKNFTISNGTAGANNSCLGDVMAQEPGSTVKHVNWIWPDCFVGDGGSGSGGSKSNGNNNGSDCDCEGARGAYNISIHQSFSINGTNYYTIFDLPIYTTNSIPQKMSRPSCDALNNKLLSESVLRSSVNTLSFQPWVGGGASITGSNIPSTGGNGNSSANGGIDSSGNNSDGGLGPPNALLRWPVSISVSWLAVTAFFISL